MSEPVRDIDYATKADIDVLRAEMKALRAEMNAGFAELRGEMRSKIAESETRMMRTLYAVAAALLAGQVAAVLTLLRLLG